MLIEIDWGSSRLCSHLIFFQRRYSTGGILGCIYHIIQIFLALSLLPPWTHIVESCYLMYTSNTWQTPWTRGLGSWAGKLWIWACAVIPAPWDWHWPAPPQALSFILLDTPFLGLSQLDIHVSELWKQNMSGRDARHFQAWHATFRVWSPLLFSSSSLMPVIRGTLQIICWVWQSQEVEGVRFSESPLAGEPPATQEPPVGLGWVRN